uniref:Uncharacterized protein n=1 Tax=Emiliania huxleyi TaxID=2903 RepID=A0A7S3T6F7_EMIHU|mmetsp:Transcript_6674/g.19328  ORF Transcript_6674/g.19328 Transcript_6674/m.19328 type:complete len:530 (-) Transcript_6674:247-1836(-)
MQTLPGEADDVSLLSGRQRFPLRKYAYALLLLLLLPVLLLVSAPVTAQLIVDSSELTVGLCEVSDPAADSAQVVCAVTARVPSLPMRVTADGTTARASRSAGGTSLGTLTVPAVDFGYGGDVALTLGGEMRVTSLQALREFAAEAQASEEVSLRLEAPLLLRFGLMLSLPVTLRKWLPLRGAQSFPNHILSVDISDADPGGGRERFPGTRLPNVISLTAEVRNPSSFALRPLGALNLSVHTPDGALVGRLSSNASAPLLLPSGASVQRLRGVLVAEKEAGLEAASRLLSDHLSGRPSHLYGVVESVSTPLYDSLFAGMRLHTTLPGLQAPLLDRVEVVVDSRRLVDWANPLDGRPLVLDAYLAISNPLAASFAVMRIDSHIFYNDQRVGRMQLVLDASDPEYDARLDGPALAPIVVSPRQQLVTGRPYPCIVEGSLATINQMQTEMRQHGTVTVVARSELKIGSGDFFTTISYDQPAVSVVPHHAPPYPPAPPVAPFSFEALNGFFNHEWEEMTVRDRGKTASFEWPLR